MLVRSAWKTGTLLRETACAACCDAFRTSGCSLPVINNIELNDCRIWFCAANPEAIVSVRQSRKSEDTLKIRAILMICSIVSLFFVPFRKRLMELSATPILEASSACVILYSFIKSCNLCCGVSPGRYSCSIGRSPRFFSVFPALCAGNPALVTEDADPSGRNSPFFCNFKRRKIFHNQPSLFTILLFIIFHNRNNLNPYFANPAAFYLAILQVLEAVFYFLARLTDFLSHALFLRTLRWQEKPVQRWRQLP